LIQKAKAGLVRLFLWPRAGKGASADALKALVESCIFVYYCPPSQANPFWKGVKAMKTTPNSASFLGLAGHFLD
jgi:hypothetical protein